jgi:malonyl-CoA/methylmalonyl-CoA synthetase
MIKLFPKLNTKNNEVALVENGNRTTYAELNKKIDEFAKGLLGNRSDLQEERVAFYIPASCDYVTTMHGIWRAGGIAIPLNVASAVSELEHYLTSAKVTKMIACGDYKA